MAWTQVGGNDQIPGGKYGPIKKWTTVGQTVEGVYLGTREGKFGPLVIIETKDGEEAYGQKSVLKRKLEALMPGDLVKIEYLGKRRSQAGTEYGDFNVWMDVAPAKQPTQPTYDGAEFQRLASLIQKDKGQAIASALEAAALAAGGDPIKNLRDAMTQIGVVPF